MRKELKRRDLSGIYIFDTFPGEEKRRPTCIEDCQPETRRKWCMAQTQDCLRNTIKHLAQTFKETTDYLVTEGCVTDEQRTELFAMIDRNVDRAKWNWAVHELADQVDFFCDKVTLLADACGVTKHKEERIMEKDKKRQQKEKFVQHLIDLYVKKQDKEDWNLNDSFDIACWFWSEMVARIADNRLIPQDELHKRVKRIMKECVEEVFKQIKEKL